MVARKSIAVTPEMVKAGIAKWALWERSNNAYPETLVKMIYRAMRILEPENSLSERQVDQRDDRGGSSSLLGHPD